MTTTTTRLIIRVPSQPERVLSPNAPRSTHWSTKANVRKAQREAWYWAALAVQGHGVSDDSPYFAGRTFCRIAVYWGKGRKSMDPDNLIASCKAGIDQLQAVGIISDDKDLILEPAWQGRDPEGVGYTLVELWQEEA